MTLRGHPFFYMYVQMLIGAYAGKIMDVEPDSARRLLATGGAVDPYAFVPEPEAELEKTTASKPEKKPTKK